jgi:hypothetical protein
MSDELGKRGRALEDAFFNKQNEALLEKLRAKEQAAKRKQGLAEATGITDEAVLDELVTAGVEPTTLTALALAPLVLLAWRDGKLEERERGAILHAAKEEGIAPGSAPYQLLDKWMADRPGDSLIDAWKGYVGALRTSLPPASYAALRKDILDRTAHVARSAGGFLGFNSVTKEEKEILARLKAILD